LVGSESG